MYDVFENILKPFCEANDYELREYSGRNFANDCLAIVIPNGTSYLIEFVSKVWENIYSENLDPETDLPIAVEWFSDFFSNIETDSMGRDDQVIYNREYKWTEYNTNDCSDDEIHFEETED